jgi:hypothetical protein
VANTSGGGSWLVVEELLEQGDPLLVDELRAIDDAEKLGAFAERWYADKRVASRRLLLEYLGRPLNAFRHEALIKRLFKLAESAGDDELMARFLVLFDRSIRREKRRRRHYENESFARREDSIAVANIWRQSGFEYVNPWSAQGQFGVLGYWCEDVLRSRSTSTMPTGKLVETRAFDPQRGRYTKMRTPDWVLRFGLDPVAFPDAHAVPIEARPRLERLRLFSIATRHYLRRRTWRYFRRLGRKTPERYVAAVTQALRSYRDADVGTGLELIDNWGLVHILFHHSKVLESRPSGWIPVSGRSLSELEPAPIFGPLWEKAPRAIADLVSKAECHPVRRWAIQRARSNLDAVRAVISMEERIDLLGHEDADVVALGAELLRGSVGLDEISAARWLTLARTPNAAALEVICELMTLVLAPDRVSFDDAVRLASSRPLPLARLGLMWLRARSAFSEAECQTVLGLVDASCEWLRLEIVRWVRGALSAAREFQTDWVLTFLDARHADVRQEGWAWLIEEPRARNDVGLWRRLVESPYDDVRLALVNELERQLSPMETLAFGAESSELDPEQLRLLWANVLLNVHRGSRAKPVVVRQLLVRLKRHPKEAANLIPLLGVALRSVRGPEWRAGLAAIVQFARRDTSARELVRVEFPELQLA